METINATWILEDGRKVQADVPLGHSFMEAALAHNVTGIVGECGGSLACATCHVHVESTPVALDEPSATEREMLELAVEAPTAASRLSCQIFAVPALDGIVFRVARF
ncbi:MAG: 2Fe-2S iron-sulfur cluster-binding protein [Burkholderiaceae bacterium]|nr:2Fe-2S iron-sulfur cluster-binding protein [Burkholderiaceae bacterium]